MKRGSFVLKRARDVEFDFQRKISEKVTPLSMVLRFVQPCGAWLADHLILKLPRNLHEPRHRFSLEQDVREDSKIDGEGCAFFGEESLRSGALCD